MDGYAHHIPERSFAMRDAEADYICKFGEGQIASNVKGEQGG